MLVSPPTRSKRCSCRLAQHLGLRGGGHFADFVEKERALMGLLELADAAAVGPGEGAAFVAEQLALQQRLGNGAHS